MLLQLQHDSQIPLHKQICEQIVHLIEEGSLRAGQRLPATRILAVKLGLNRSTVYQAYQDLWALGYIESRPGSYSTVRGRLHPAHADSLDKPSRVDWKRMSTPTAKRSFALIERLNYFAQRKADQKQIDFSRLTADRNLCPVDALKSAFRQVIRKHGRELFEYGDPAGYAPLRATIARAMRIHGVEVTADEILITNGSHHGLDLILHMLGRRGSKIAVESPTYAMGLALCRQHNLPVCGIPMREDGLDLAQLKRRLTKGRIACLYTMPNFHNPTGITTTQAHRDQVLALCEQHRVPIVEDGFEEELKYFGQAVLPIKSMDTQGIVIYLGTFSKVIFPGLRVGWIAAHRECIARLVPLIRVSGLSGNMLTQAAVSRFCDEGSYEEHIRRVHLAYRRRMQTMLHSLKAFMPNEGITWTQPLGGYTLLLRVQRRAVSEEDLYKTFRQAGVQVSPGSQYFPDKPHSICFRLCIANLTEEQIQEGCQRLGQVLTQEGKV